jgi:two-component system response regulator PilR (NtrC family)
LRALIVDDEPNIRKVLNRILAETGFDSFEAGSAAEAAEALHSTFFDFAVLDLRLPDGSGIDLLKTIKDTQPDTTVLIITAFASAETAITAMKLGAYDYVTKPFNIDELRIVIKNIQKNILLQKRVKELQQYADVYQFMVGKSEAMKKVFNTIDKIAPFDTNVLITGESGTGKELVAKAIHQKSRRSETSFIAVNCASLPAELLESELFGYSKGAFTGAYTTKRGLIEEADKGTLFLDEIGEMPLSLQAKLLRFLEDRKIRPLGSSTEIQVDVRIISATNRPVAELTASGDFRDDLYYRLATFELGLPSLRDRREDIPLLINHFVKALAKKFEKTINRIEPDFIDAIMQHELKGNVRELKNMIERSIILSDDGRLRYSAAAVKPQPCEPETELPDTGFDLNRHLSDIEARMLSSALKKADGVKSKAAELLGLTFREFRYKLSKHKTK